MLDKFLSYIKENRLLTSKDKILLAVSSGIDSVVMLNLFHKAKLNFAVAHCNFRLRSGESDGDEIFTQKLADKYKAKFHVKSFDTVDYSKKNNLSIQMTARELRYNWFFELAEKYHYSCIAIAHNSDDLVETFLINLARGTGIKGLTGIKPKQNNIIRPLLFASRKEIEEYAEIYKISFREDSSNSDIKYQRNLIRHKIVPLFEKLNPSFKQTIMHETEILNSTFKVYDQELKKLYNAITIQEIPNHVLSIQKTMALKLGPEILYDLLEKYGFSYSIVQNIHASLTAEAGKLFYSENYVLLKDRKTLIIEVIQKPEEINSFDLNKGVTRIEYPVSLSFSERIRPENFKIPVSKTSISVDLGLLNFPLRLRKWEKGDYFYPLGMKNKKKLSDFFTDRKINRLEKEKLWVLTSGKDIVWIVGQQIDDRFKVTASTTNLLLICLNE